MFGKCTNLGVFGSDDGPEFGDGDLSLVFGTALVDDLNDGFLAARVGRNDPFELILVREVVPEHIIFDQYYRYVFKNLLDVFERRDFGCVIGNGVFIAV